MIRSRFIMHRCPDGSREGGARGKREARVRRGDYFWQKGRMIVQLQENKILLTDGWVEG